MLEEIMKIFGREKLSNIKIQDSFKRNPPKYEKILEKIAYYNTYQNFEQPIVVDKDNMLIDGYTTYLIAKKLGMRYVKVKRI